MAQGKTNHSLRNHSAGTRQHKGEQSKYLGKGISTAWGLWDIREWILGIRTA
jgi:hypothetical protein